MQHPHPRRFRTKLGVAALAASALVAGSACGAGASPVASKVSSQQGTAVQTPPSVRVDVKRELRKLEASYKARVGAWILDTGTGRTVGYRAGESFPSLSTFKALACAGALDKARRTDPGLMERVVHWKASEEVPNSDLTKGRGEAGMTVSALCHATITTSDNTAGNMVLKQIGGPAGLTRYYRSLGDRISRLDRWETDLNLWKPGERRDTTTPAAMGRDLYKVALGGSLVPQDRKRLNDWMRATVTGDERIRAGVPKGWVVGDKTGTGDEYAPANDIAVAWPPSGAPIVIAVYTNRRAPEAEIDNKLISATTSVLVRGLGKTP